MPKPGLTFIEVIVVVAISAVVLTGVFVGFSGFTSSQRLSVISEEIISLIRNAREDTISSKGGFAYGIHFEENNLTLFQAPSYTLGDQGNIVYNIQTGYHISAINLQGGGDEILFEKITGAANPIGTITVAKDSGAIVEKVIRIYASGTVEIE